MDADVLFAAFLKRDGDFAVLTGMKIGVYGVEAPVSVTNVLNGTNASLVGPLDRFGNNSGAAANATSLSGLIGNATGAAAGSSGSGSALWKMTAPAGNSSGLSPIASGP